MRRSPNNTFMFGIAFLCLIFFPKVPLGFAEICDCNNANYHLINNAENPPRMVSGGFPVMVDMCAIEVAVKDLMTRQPALGDVSLVRYTQDSGWKCYDSFEKVRDCSYGGGFILKAGGILFEYQVKGYYSTFTALLKGIETADGKYVVHRSPGQVGPTSQKKAPTHDTISTVTFSNTKGGVYTWDNISEGGRLTRDEVWIFGNIRGKLINYAPPQDFRENLKNVARLLSSLFEPGGLNTAGGMLKKSRFGSRESVAA